VEVTGRWLGHYAQAERDAFHVAHLARRLRKEELAWAALEASSRVHGYQGKLDDAVREGRESVALATKLFGANDLRVARAHGALSNALAELGELEESEREDRRAMEINEHLLGPSHPSMVRMLTNLATGLVWAGRAHDALPVAHRAEALAAQELEADHPQHGLAWNVIGYAEVALGHFQAGLEANQRSLAVYEHHGADYVEIVYPLAGMGEALLGLNRAAEAADVLTRATHLAEAHGLDAETMGVCHFHLGRALWLSRDERTRAVALVQQSVADFGRVPRLRDVRTRAESWLAEHAGPHPRR
jgi:tetratricopeptide (TPR) repeat protein